MTQEIPQYGEKIDVPYPTTDNRFVAPYDGKFVLSFLGKENRYKFLLEREVNVNYVNIVVLNPKNMVPYESSIEIPCEERDQVFFKKGYEDLVVCKYYKKLGQ